MDSAEAKPNGDVLEAEDNSDDSDSFFDAEDQAEELPKVVKKHKNMQKSASETSLHDSDSSLEYTYENGKVKGILHTKDGTDVQNDVLDSGPSTHVHVESHEKKLQTSSSGNHEIFEEANFSFDYDENSDVQTTTTRLQQKLSVSSAASAENSEYRKCLPSAMFSRDDFSLWSILKQCIGKELSKITMPVIFNEPLSFLQRVCEYMEYTNLLKKANETHNSIDRMQYVAAFSVSAVASQLGRVGKPYNPLLGETYEINRPDLGFHWVSEQVSHHPPISAFYATDCDKDTFIFHGSVWPKLKFWGKSVQVEPKGIMTLELKKHGEVYTWSNPMCSVHNVVVGTPWIEQHGVVRINNHKTGEKCSVNFKAVGWFKGELNKVEGEICNSGGEVVRHLEGDWTTVLYSLSPKKHAEFISLTRAKPKKGQKKSSVIAVKPFELLKKMNRETPDECTLLWSAEPRPEVSKEMYNMTEFAMSLNEKSKEHDKILPPTDTRFRPDIRHQENGDIEKAGDFKHKLEEKQRAARRTRSKQKEEFVPRWFSYKKHPNVTSDEWSYNQEYGKRDWKDVEIPEWFNHSETEVEN